MYYFDKPVSDISVATAGIWVVISAVIALMGALVIYFCFLNKENEEKVTGKMKWLYDFLSFKKLFAESLLKIAYLVTAIFLTLSSFAIIGTSFLGFLCYLVFGNVIARVAYEFSLAILLICKNTTEINSKMSIKSYATTKQTKKDSTEENK